MKELTWKNIKNEITKAVPDLSDQDKEAMFFFNIEWMHSGLEERCFFMVLNDEHIVYISENVVDILGHKAVDMINRSIYEFTPENNIAGMLYYRLNICKDGYPVSALIQMHRTIQDNLDPEFSFVFFPGSENKIFTFCYHYPLYYALYEHNRHHKFIIQKRGDIEAVLQEYDILRGQIEAAIMADHRGEAPIDSFRNGLKEQINRFEKICCNEMGLNLGYGWDNEDYGQPGI